MSDATALMRHPCLMAGSPGPPVRALLASIEVIRKSTILRKVQRDKNFMDSACLKCNKENTREGLLLYNV